MRILTLDALITAMKLKPQFRSISSDDFEIDEETRTVKFSFSSEYPVDRYFGKEILSHAPGACDLSRLNNGANHLWNHDMDIVLGVSEGAEIRSDLKKGFIKVRFSKSPEADQKFNDIKDKILRNVSFGYIINEMTCLNPGSKSEDPVYLATKWTPYETSSVSVPADPTVGLGRSSMQDQEFDVRVISETGKTWETNKMKTEPVKTDDTNVKVDERVARNEEYAKIKADGVAEERTRVAAITGLGERFKNAQLARQLIEGGKSFDEARDAFMTSVGQKQIPLTGNEAEVGLSEKEKRSYSWVRAMHFLANPHDPKAREMAKFEIEVSTAAAEKSGKAARGLVVPVDMLRHKAKRDLTVGTSTAGGNFVATELESASFIELLRNKSVLQRAGATVLNGLVGNIAIPKQTGASTAYWVSESGAPTEGQQAIGQVTMSPKTVGAYTDYSRKLLLQSSIDVENFVRSDLAAIIALEIDRVGMYGTGSSNQPQGLKSAIAGGSNEINFAAATPTFAEVISLESAITAANADLDAMKYIINANMQGSLKGAVKVSGFPVYILENGQMNGYPVLMSNQVASGDVMFGDWSQLLMGFWSGLDLMVDPYSQSTSGTVRIVALQDCDMALRHKESFSRGNDTP